MLCLAQSFRRWMAPTFNDRPEIPFIIVGILLLLFLIWGPIPAASNWWAILIFIALAMLGTWGLWKQTTSEYPEAHLEGEGMKEKFSRAAASSLYHAVSASLLAAEGAATGAAGGDARRLLLAKLVLDHRLGVADPFAPQVDGNEDAIVDLLLDAAPVPLQRATQLIAG